MAGESLTFDILARDQASGAFAKTADAAGKASGNVRQLGRDLDDVGKKRATPVLAVDDKDASAKLKDVTGRLDALGKKVAQARVSVQDKDAQARLAALGVKLDSIGRKTADPRIKVDGVDKAEADILAVDASLDKLSEKTASPKISLQSPGLGATAGLLSPTLLPLAGGISAAIAGIGVSFGAAAAGAGLFGIAASSVLSAANTNATKLQALEVKLNTATTAAQKKAVQQQITALEAGWSKGYITLLGNLEGFKTAWGETSQAIAVPALTKLFSALTDSLGFVQAAAAPVAAVFGQWGAELDQYFTSSKGSAEITRIATAFGKFSASQLKDVGVFVVDIGKGVFALGQDIAGHNVDFGAFGADLDKWGAAFARWSQSAAARQDVSNFLAYLHANGPLVGDLLKNLGKTLATFSPGLSSVGSLELRLVSDFLGILAKTPKFIAQPLIDTAGALLLLQKTGVLSIGIKVVGAAVKWLSGGVIDIGGGASAAAEIRAAFTSGGAAAAAEIRAAMTSGGAAGGAAGGAEGAVTGGGAAGATAGKAAAGGFAAAFRAALSPALAGVVVGAVIRSVGDSLSPAGTFAGNLNKQFQKDGGLWSTSLLHSFTFGGLDSWMAAKFGIPVGGFINGVLKDMVGASSKSNQSVQRNFAQTGQAVDVAKAKVGNFAGEMQDNLNKAVAAAGTHADAFRISHLGPLGSKIDSVNKQTGNLQATINNLHGKTVDVGVHGSGSGGAKITVSSVGGGAFAGKLVEISNRALGGFISGGVPNTDSVPAMLMPGEVVVPTGMVKSGAVDHLRGRLPGFATGGLVSPAPFVTGTEGSFGTDGKNAFGAEASAAYKAIISSATDALKAQAAAAAAGGAPGAQGGPTSASAAQAQAYARSRLGAYGWGSGQMGSLISLWNRESGWNRFARNPSSGAYGIPQALPASKMGAAANPPTSSAAAQINWGLGYIKGRYGSPAGAWGHETSFGWYDQGGSLGPGLTLAMNGTGQSEQVIPGQGWAGMLAQLGQILAAIQQLSGILTGASGGGAGFSSVGNFNGVVSPAGGGFGLTRSDLGLPATDTSSSSTSSTDTSGTSTSSTSTTPAKPAKKAAPNAAQKAAANVLERLMGGYIHGNKLAQAHQANSILDWLGVTKYNSQLGQITHLDSLLLSYRKAKNTKAEKAVATLLAHLGVHSSDVQTSVKKNQPQADVITRITSLIKADIAGNNLTTAHQANAILTHLGDKKYSGTLGQIAYLDGLLKKYKKAKDTRDVKATETLLRTYGVKKFAAGGWITEPVTGIGASGQIYQFAEAGRPELVVPARSGGGGDGAAVAELQALRAQVERMIQVAAAIPARTGQHVSAGINGAAGDASFRSRYPVRGR